MIVLGLGLALGGVIAGALIDYPTPNNLLAAVAAWCAALAFVIGVVLFAAGVLAS